MRIANGLGLPAADLDVLRGQPLALPHRIRVHKLPRRQLATVLRVGWYRKSYVRVESPLLNIRHLRIHIVILPLTKKGGGHHHSHPIGLPF